MLVCMWDENKIPTKAALPHPFWNSYDFLVTLEIADVNFPRFITRIEKGLHLRMCAGILHLDKTNDSAKSKSISAVVKKGYMVRD